MSTSNELSKAECVRWLETKDPQALQTLYKQAYAVKQEHVGTKVFYRGIIEFSNICEKDCFYCGIRRSNKNVKRYVVEDDDVVEAAIWAWQQNYGSIVLQSGEMKINVRTTQHTAIRVQVLDGETAEPIPGYTWEEAKPISGDHIFAGPRWQEHEDLSELVGRPVRIEIAMREAEVFAIRTDCQVFVGLEPTETL